MNQEEAQAGIRRTVDDRHFHGANNLLRIFNLLLLWYCSLINRMNG